MNRKRSNINSRPSLTTLNFRSNKAKLLNNKLPFSSEEFMELKSHVSEQIRKHERHRYQLSGNENQVNSVHCTTGPSMFHRSLESFNIGDQNRRGSNSLHNLTSVQSTFKIKKYKLSRQISNSKSKQYDLKDPVVSLDRFRKILKPKEDKLCRLC